MAKTRGKGRKQNRAKNHKRTNVGSMYGKPALDVDLNNIEFRFTVVRPEKRDRINVDDIIETVNWVDQGPADAVNAIPVMTGSVSFRKPAPEHAGLMPDISDGHMLRCEARWFGKWRPLWKMRLATERIAIDSGEWTFELADEMSQLAKSEGTYRYKAKKGQRGITYDKIVRNIARKYGIPVGQLVRGTERIKNFRKASTPVSLMIHDALGKEIRATGRRYLMRWGPDKHGKYGLQITPMRRNPFLYTFGPQIMSATLGEDRRGDLATVIRATGHMKKGKKGKRKKVKVKVVSKPGKKRYGHIERHINLKGTQGSRARVRKLAKRKLARGLKPKRVITDFTHPGVPFVRRGDCIRVAIPDEGYVRKRGIVFVTGVTHDYSAGSYNMTLTLDFIDPLDPEKVRKERQAAIRRKKRAARERKDDK